MAQNIHNAVIHLGHQNGCVTLWTPNLPHPAVQLLAHLGPVVGLSVDPSQGGRYMATAGRDGTVKVWDCRNWKGAVRDWALRGGGDAELDWSAKGSLAVASGGSVNVSSGFCLSHSCERLTGNGVDIYGPFNTHADAHQNPSAFVPDAPGHPSSTYLRAFHAVPGRSNHRALSRTFEYPRAWFRGA